jgi:ABC-2 type transport system ATP-binding protein
MPPDVSPALRVRGLTKAFGDRRAVDAADLEVPRGSFFGVVGPNGAGKTTLLSMATGLLRPDAGTCEILGLDMWDRPQQAKARLGVLPDGLALPERLTGPEVLTHVGRLRGIEAAELDRRVGDLTRVMGLGSAGRTLVIDYSTGMRKKIGLALALLHAPGVVVLDEPFEGVDPVSAATLRTVLFDYRSAGGTVVLSSHAMALVEQIADHVAVMADGSVVAAGPMDEVRAGRGLEERFVELVGSTIAVPELAWLVPSSD